MDTARARPAGVAGNVSRERYLPYGTRRGTDDLPFTDLGFLGKTEDATTDLLYLGARYYDPAIAKFISTDPELDLRTPEWANPYSYAAGNPIDQSDPDGRRVDAGGGSSDKSYGYSRDKKTPNANQNFAKTHHASGKKKTKTEQKVHRKRHQNYERVREQRRQDANYARNRRDALRKQEILIIGPRRTRYPARPMPRGYPVSTFLCEADSGRSVNPIPRSNPSDRTANPAAASYPEPKCSWPMVGPSQLKKSRLVTEFWLPTRRAFRPLLKPSQH
ncbi:RHS repeat-associated core domain-containing protein [Nonomuraea sp. NPDC050790]|uniref:RHS repeat-associated core domain-containing protein n=1 Tax=Nonomuraea sp. NPDC050790 TaxID=3364371 RepID=UPI0037ABDB40